MTFQNIVDWKTLDRLILFTSVSIAFRAILLYFPGQNVCIW